MIADYLPRNKFRGNNITKAYGFFKFAKAGLISFLSARFFSETDFTIVHPCIICFGSLTLESQFAYASFTSFRIYLSGISFCQLQVCSGTDSLAPKGFYRDRKVHCPNKNQNVHFCLSGQQQ